jgi:hypothetical protein
MFVFDKADALTGLNPSHKENAYMTRRFLRREGSSRSCSDEP